METAQCPQRDRARPAGEIEDGRGTAFGDDFHDVKQRLEAFLPAEQVSLLLAIPTLLPSDSIDLTSAHDHMLRRCRSFGPWCEAVVRMQCGSTTHYRNTHDCHASARR